MPGSEKTRTRVERAEATREALIATGHRLFAERGYAEVGTEEIVAEADVTRGALYHHFADKRDLFRAVHERVEEELVGRIAARMEGISGEDSRMEVLRTGTRAFLEACEEPALKQIALVDAPAVLGWSEWREIDERYGLGLMKGVLGAAMEAGELRPVPLDALAHLMLGALSEAAFVIANADDPVSARSRVESVLFEMLAGLRAS